MKPEEWLALLVALGRDVRAAVIESRNRGEDLARPVAHEGGDTIFLIDRKVEPVLERHARRWLAAGQPLLLVAEGLGAEGRERFGPPGEPLRWRLIVDPIDGTRNIMYDKRSAWFLAAVAPERGEETSLRDCVASVAIELPPSKGGAADELSATREGVTTGVRVDLASGREAAIPVRPSPVETLRNGFAQVSSFFPGTKLLAASLMERIVEATLGGIRPGEAAVFEDQYITTGGQLVELAVGHDRFTCDLRPLFYRAMERQSGERVRGLEVHPYDLAGLLVAERAGVIVTDGFGRPLDAPLDVQSPVHWCGYANDSLRRAIEPVVQGFFAALGVEPAP